jgi:uncharacterized membrane protein
MPRFCASCGAQVADTATFCPACGKTVAQAQANPGYAAAPAPAPAAPAAGGLTDNVAGMLAYITIIPAIIFLVMEPYNKKPFVRFHAFQCLFLAVASFALGIVLMIVGMVPVVGWIVTLVLGPIIWILVLIVVIVCLLKAYQGQMWKLPVIGDMAEKQANAV